MISPLEAMRLVHQHAPRPYPQKVSLAESFGLVLAEDVRAPLAMPVADNSAMDGYVVRACDVAKASATHPVFLQIKGTVKAGDSKFIRIKPGTACRIMTGAFIPQGGEAVIPREDVMVQGHNIVVKKPVVAGQHVRWKGEEVRKGDLLIKKGTWLNPAAIGVLATFGFASVWVYRKPRVVVIATGNELTQPGKKLGAGKIYDSNSWMMRAALMQMGVGEPGILILRDHLRQVRKAIRSALIKFDYLILLGGVSVGDYDVVKQALNLEKVKTIFWRVSQKPGKPLFAGRKGKKIVFGLPGNPAAAFTCFYEYVYPALMRSLGYVHSELKKREVSVKGAIAADSKRHLFLKAQISKTGVAPISEARILSGQGSHMLTALVEADGFLRVPTEVGKKKSHGLFQMDFLPYREQG